MIYHHSAIAPSLSLTKGSVLCRAEIANTTRGRMFAVCSPYVSIYI